jgi:hypothetical protein
LAVQCIKRDDGAAGDAEFGQQLLRRRDLIGFLSDVDMGEHDGGVGSERAQHLGGGTVTEVVEAAAQRLAIESDAALSGRRARSLQQGGMAAENHLHCGRIEPLEDVADCGVRGCSAPLQAESRVQPVAMNVDEGNDAPIRVAAGYDGKDGKQQHMGQLVELAFRPARIRNVVQQAQQRCERSHGNLRLGCRPRSQTFSDSGILRPVSRFTSVPNCCIADSVQPIRQR